MLMDYDKGQGLATTHKEGQVITMELSIALYNNAKHTAYCIPYAFTLLWGHRCCWVCMSSHKCNI